MTPAENELYKTLKPHIMALGRVLLNEEVGGAVKASVIAGLMDVCAVAARGITAEDIAASKWPEIAAPAIEAMSALRLAIHSTRKPIELTDTYLIPCRDLTKP